MADVAERMVRAVEQVEDVYRGLVAAGEARTIKVWRFRDAPEAMRRMSAHGGDEDWVAWVPPGYDEYVGWLEEGGAFGCFSVSEHQLPDGSMVFIGAHW